MARIEQRFDELYARHSTAAYRLAYVLTGDDRLAEDLVQEAFTKLFGRLAGLRNPDAFEQYLRVTILNLSRSHFRRAKRERVAIERDRVTNSAVSVDTLPEPDVIWQRLQQLPWRQRAAVVLRFYEDLSEEETAQRLNCSARAVNSLVSRAMGTLRAEVEADHE